MSTKTIAVETGVYEKLAALKRESESFTKVIDRLIEGNKERTIGEIMDDLRRSDLEALSDSDARLMEQARSENRVQTVGRPIDLS